MLNFFKKFFKISIFSLAAVMCHFASASFLPYPLNQVNIILVFLILTLITKNKETVLWLALIIGFLTEPFVTTSFGINTLALLFCIWATYWLYNNIFIHHSVFLIIILSVLSIIIYRTLFFIILIATSIIGNKDVFALFFWPIMLNILWEMGFTVTALIIFYTISSYFNKIKLNSSDKALFYERIFRA